MEPRRGLIAPHHAYLACCVLIVAGLALLGWDGTWQKLGIGTLHPVFADLRTVQGGLASLVQGLDPQVTNPGDPWGRPMNYPSPWLGLARLLGWQDERAFLVFAGLSGAAFAACCFDLIRRWPSWWAVVLAVPGAAALMVERANNDAVIFALVYCAAISARPLFAALLPLATLLKLYPLLALPAFARNRRALMIAAAGCAAALALLLPELPLIRAATPASPLMSFGLPVYAAALGQAGLPFAPVAVGAGLVALTLMARSLIDGRIGAPALCPGGHDPAALRLFLAGAAIFLGATLLGANWDYRLCFLLMAVPLVSTLPSAALRTGLFVAMVIAFNQPLIEDAWGLAALRVNLLAKAALFVAIGALALRIYPREWLRLRPLPQDPA